MNEHKRDETKLAPACDAEERKPAQPRATMPRGGRANATNAVIPGIGTVIKDARGKEAKRLVNT